MRTASSVEKSLDFGGGPFGPEHVAIIMDGNGRWAERRGLPRAVGHREGVEAAKRTVRAAGDLGIKTLTLFAFSSENWSRPRAEVRDLMGLLRLYLKTELKQLHKEGVRLRVIGRRSRLDADINRLIDEAEAQTAGNTRMRLVIALNYGARDEIVDAARALATAVVEGRVALENIDAARFTNALATRDLPDPDLVIRTSGEQRVSNFLLWQIAYAELYFTETLWPDFGEPDLRAALESFSGRERRFGGRL